MEAFIRNKVAGGCYGIAAEVICDAIRRMQAEDGRVAAWQAAMKAGDVQFDHGEGIAYGADALSDITKTAIDAVHSGKAIDPDVLP